MAARYVRGAERFEITAPGSISVNESTAHVNAALAGLGLVHPPNRHLSAKLRVFVDWVVEVF